jgi:hypothetical protein
MGDIDESPEDSFHGILHLLTHAEFAHLDTIEGIYRRTPVKVTTYDGKIVDAFAYKMDQSRLDKSMPDALPGERYIDIIMRGARHFGVKEEYIEKLRQQPVVPRKKPSEYRRIQTPPWKIIPKSVFEAAKGAPEFDPAFPMMVCVNGKVLSWVDPPDNPQQKMMYDWSRQRYAGANVSLAVCKTLYEPIYPLPTTYEAMPAEMKAWAEELFVGFTSRFGATQEGMKLGNWEIIGWLEGMEPKDPKVEEAQCASSSPPPDAAGAAGNNQAHPAAQVAAGNGAPAVAAAGEVVAAAAASQQQS